MRIILELISGPEAGRRVSLIANQEITVGRSSWAEFVVDDPEMAAKHFLLEADYEACRVRDLSDGRQTYLNNQPVQRSEVCEGDEIRAGRSVFRVRGTGLTARSAMHGAGQAGSPSADRAPPAAPPRKVGAAAGAAGLGEAVPPRAAPAKPQDVGEYTGSVCTSGAHCFVGNSPDAVASIAQNLGLEHGLHLIVDYRKWERESPPNLKTEDFVFDWMGEAAYECSPVLVPGETAQLIPVLVEAWGHNAVVGLFAANPRHAVAAHVRSFCRVGEDKLVGLCWPNVLRMLLENYESGYVKGLLSPLRAVLVEGPPEEPGWWLFSKDDLSEILRRVGLHEAAYDAN